METQEIMNKEIGTKEPENTVLEPKKVKIVDVTIQNIEKAKSDKVVFEVKHPDREKTITISSVAFPSGKAVKNVGTWLNVDDDGNLQKGTGLTVFLDKIGIRTLAQAIGKEADTELNESYLTFKAY